VGVLNLALAALVLAVLLRPERYFVMVVAAAELVYTAPHFLYHLAHLDLFEAGDKVGLMVSLGVSVIAPIALLLRSSRRAEEAIHR
jgi:threonine/homoserine efflux transporter RhtA